MCLLFVSSSSSLRLLIMSTMGQNLLFSVLISTLTVINRAFFAYVTIFVFVYHVASIYLRFWGNVIHYLVYESIIKYQRKVKKQRFSPTMRHCAMCTGLKTPTCTIQTSSHILTSHRAVSIHGSLFIFDVFFLIFFGCSPY